MLIENIFRLCLPQNVIGVVNRSFLSGLIMLQNMLNNHWVFLVTSSMSKIEHP